MFWDNIKQCSMLKPKACLNLVIVLWRILFTKITSGFNSEANRLYQTLDSEISQYLEANTSSVANVASITETDDVSTLKIVNVALKHKFSQKKQQGVSNHRIDHIQKIYKQK